MPDPNSVKSKVENQFKSSNYHPNISQIKSSQQINQVNDKLNEERMKSPNKQYKK